MVSQGNWRATRALTDSTNNVADKALTNKKWLQGELQGGSEGEALKKAEGGGLTILVVCDTGSFDGSVENYVLEEEGGEVDGLFENEKNVVEYGVRDVSDPMEGKFIILSKWIPYCLLLTDVRVKHSRDMWEYVEDEVPWFRRELGLNFTFTVP